MDGCTLTLYLYFDPCPYACSSVSGLRMTPDFPVGWQPTVVLVQWTKSWIHCFYGPGCFPLSWFPSLITALIADAEHRISLHQITWFWHTWKWVITYFFHIELWSHHPWMVIYDICQVHESNGCVCGGVCVLNVRVAVCVSCLLSGNAV